MTGTASEIMAQSSSPRIAASAATLALRETTDGAVAAHSTLAAASSVAPYKYPSASSGTSSDSDSRAELSLNIY